MSDMKIVQLLASVQGRDEDGEPKAMVTLQLLETLNNNDWIVVDEVSTVQAEANLVLQGNIVTLVLDFDSDIDYDFLRFSAVGEHYNELIQKRWETEPVKGYALNFSVIPQGEYDSFIHAICTGWYYVPEKTTQPHKIAFIGDAGNFTVMEIPDELMQQMLDEVGQELTEGSES